VHPAIAHACGDAAAGNRALNDILVTLHTFRGAIAISTDSLAGLVSDANVVTPRFTLDGGGSAPGLAAWQAATGQDARSVASVPAAGLAATDVITDFDGQPRPAGPAADAGADEGGSPDTVAPSASTTVRAR
jgi:hypothetical protein